MRELYRRFGALLLLFTAVAFFLAVRDDVICLYAVDMAEEYQSTYIPAKGWGASGAARSVVRSSKRIASIAAFIDSQTEGRDRRGYTIVDSSPLPALCRRAAAPRKPERLGHRAAHQGSRAG